jgi:FtsZ-binding cell division protein ZapB
LNQVVKPLEQQITEQAETIRLLSLEIDQVRREALAAKERAEDWERACREQIAEVAELREAQKRLTDIYEERGRQFAAIRNVLDGGASVEEVVSPLVKSADVSIAFLRRNGMITENQEWIVRRFANCPLSQ